MPVEHIWIAALGDNIKSGVFATCVISARHVNASAAFGQFQRSLFADSRVATSYDYHFALDMHVRPSEFFALIPKPKAKITIQCVLYTYMYLYIFYLRASIPIPTTSIANSTYQDIVLRG